MPRWYRLRPGATSCRQPSAVSLRHEEWLPLREIDGHRAADLAQQLRRDFVQAPFASPILDALGDDAAHERRDAIEPRPRGGRPGERGGKVCPITHARRLDDLDVPTRLICA